MDCQVTDARLIDFCFAALDHSAVADVERHLSACPSCLSHFFAVKRDLDASKLSTSVPSPLARARIFKEFDRYASHALRTRPRTLKRLVIGGLAAAAVILGLVSYRMTHGPSEQVQDSIDAGGIQTTHSNIL